MLLAFCSLQGHGRDQIVDERAGARNCFGNVHASMIVAPSRRIVTDPYVQLRLGVRRGPGH